MPPHEPIFFGAFSVLADVIRAIVIFLCAYGVAMSFLTRRTFLKRIRIERDNFIHTMPETAVTHVKRVTIWGMFVAMVVLLDAWQYFTHDIRWNTLAYLIISGYLVHSIRPMYYFELAMYEMRMRDVEKAKQAAKAEREPHPVSEE